jgi:hypothetical protein
MKCDFWASLLACTFASPCLGCKPNVKVATCRKREKKKEGAFIDDKAKTPLVLIVFFGQSFNVLRPCLGSIPKGV